MKVRCIDNDLWDHIKVNEIYKVEMMNKFDYHIKTDEGVFYYPKDLFEVVEDSIEIENLEISDLDSKIKELKEQLDILMKAKEILEK